MTHFTLYRIYCQDVDRKLMEAVLQKYLEGYTIVPASGFYKGVREQSVVIDAFDTTKEIVQTVCKELAEVLHQEAVVFVAIPLYMVRS